MNSVTTHVQSSWSTVMRLLLASVAALVLLMIEGSLAINFSLDPDPDSTIESVIQCPGDPLFVPLNGNFTPISSGYVKVYM